MKKVITLAWFLGFWGMMLTGRSLAQSSGTIWVKTFLPGSADLNDPTIDRTALTFVDSLMKNPDLEVQFLGGADHIRWRHTGRSVVAPISNAWDAAKKLERASALRQRYGRGEIGTTDEPIRGVKVVWRPKPPDPFAMARKIGLLENLVDSLATQLEKLSHERWSALPPDSSERRTDLVTVTPASDPAIFSDWEVKTGYLLWSAGRPWDLSLPYLGLSLNRQHWAFEVQGGFTPWSKEDPLGDRGDAMLLGAVNLFPRSWLELKIGAFSGWEFFTHSDQWTMKVMGLTAGPKLSWKSFEIYAGYAIGKISSLTEPDQWQSGGMIATCLNLKIN